jgi:uncharacterized protein YndB with AHSA1/START domain
MTEHSAAHTSFVIERRFEASPARVFMAWADPAAKQRWADCHADGGTTEYSLDFRVGGHELQRALLPDGRSLFIDKVFLEIVSDARIIFAYTMTADDRALSASLATVEFQAERKGTSMRFTEQLAYLDGHEDVELRIKGTNDGFDRLLLELSKMNCGGKQS